MDEFLINLEKFARQNNIPVILDDTRDFLVELCKEINPKNILEIGMAIGYSGSNLLKASPNATLTCLEASTPNIKLARQNFKAQGLEGRVNIIEGDCLKTLPTLKEQFDLIFLDGPKGKYVDMVDMIIPLMHKNSVWVSDNVLFRGMVLDGQEIPSERFKVTVGLLRQFIQKLQSNTNLDTQILHIGDGLSVVKFKK